MAARLVGTALPPASFLSLRDNEKSNFALNRRETWRELSVAAGGATTEDCSCGSFLTSKQEQGVKCANKELFSKTTAAIYNGLCSAANL